LEVECQQCTAGTGAAHIYLSLYRTNMLQNPLFLEGLQHTTGSGVNVSLRLALLILSATSCDCLLLPCRIDICAHLPAWLVRQAVTAPWQQSGFDRKSWVRRPCRLGMMTC
jgi:hypothetical protein